LKIAVVYNRLGFAKWFGPLIAEAEKRGHEVEIWLDHHDISKTNRWYEFPYLEKMPRFTIAEPKYLIYKNDQEFSDLTKNSDADVIFSVPPPPPTKTARQTWVHIITNVWDSIPGFTPERLNLFDVIVTNTQLTKDIFIGYFHTTLQMKPGDHLERSLLAKAIVAGSPQYDHFSRCNPVEFKKRAGIPIDARVITVMMFEHQTTYWAAHIFAQPNILKRIFAWIILPITYPYFFSKVGKKKLFRLVGKSLFDRVKYFTDVFTCPSEIDVHRTVKDFCVKNGYFLVHKYRKRNPVMNEISELPDLVIDCDSEYFPYHSAQLISASDLIVTLYSSSVNEAVYAGVPALNIHSGKGEPLFKDFYNLRHTTTDAEREAAEIRYLYNNNPLEQFNFSEAIWSMSLREFVKDFPKKTLADYQPSLVMRERFVKKYLHEHNQMCSAVILDKIEVEVARKAANS
jgi:hypothetical protein